MRYKYTTEKSEMKRRHKAVLEAMEKEGIECLVLASKNPELYGAIRYLTDLPYSNYPYMALFSRDGVFVFAHGAKGLPPTPKHLGLEIAGGLAFPYIESIGFWDNVYPEEMTKIIKKHGYKKVGFVGMGFVPASIYKYLTENLQTIEFVDATVLVDRIKAVKSEYELIWLMKCVKIHDLLAAAVPTVLMPGRTERDVVRELRYLADGLGCEELNIMIGSDPVVTGLFPYKFATREIQPGDRCQVLIEVATQGGYWGHVGRVYSLGEPAPAMQQITKDTLELQDLVASSCKPGTTGEALFRLLNRFLADHGYNSEKRIIGHSQSYDIADRPYFLEGDQMEICENMFVAIHPNCTNTLGHGYICDNYLVKKDGAIRLSKTERGIIVIDI